MVVNSSGGIVALAKKRIAIFLDGTWNTVDDNTNVWRLKALCAPKSKDGLEQKTYYNSGVGTKTGEKVRGGMFGYGLNDAIIAAYEWLIEQYNSDDEIFVFGFSRGAYTARSLSGLISKCGLLSPGASLSVNQLYARYRRGASAATIRTLLSQRDDGKRKFDIEEQWLLKYSLPISIKFIGVWDTVGALGIPFANVPGFGKSDMQFLNTGLRTSNDFAFHALAIDEHRKAFAPTLWTKQTPTIPDLEIAPPRPLSQVEQRWFVGAHANVGGGCQSDVLAQVPLKWMVEKASLHGLAFRREVDLDGQLEAAPISDSYSEFLHGFYKATTGGRRFLRTIGSAPIVADASTMNTINETIDASVFARWNIDKSYRPQNLTDWAIRYGADISGLRNTVMAHDPTLAIS